MLPRYLSSSPAHVIVSDPQPQLLHVPHLLKPPFTHMYTRVRTRVCQPRTAGPLPVSVARRN